MKKNSLFKTLAIEIIFFLKGFLSRFYFEKINHHIFSITPSLCTNPIKKEIFLLWGKWAFVFWYGRY
jgi:hypothetical protein